MHPGYAYTAFFCEENAWHLCQTPPVVDRSPWAIIVGNAVRSCPLCLQRAGPPDGGPIFWDYHVFVVGRGEAGPEVWDLDTRLPFPCAAGAYLRATFAAVPFVPRRQAPVFRVMPGPEYVATLSSDRRHMLDRRGRPLQPFPPWPPIGAGRPSNLMRLLDFADPFAGELLDLDGMLQRFGDGEN